MSDYRTLAQELEYRLGAVWPYKILGIIIDEARRSAREACAKEMESYQGRSHRDFTPEVAAQIIRGMP